MGNSSDLVFFNDAISHILRLSRAIRQSRGSVMSIGVAGSGK
jgi:dynein heavy chain